MIISKTGNVTCSITINTALEQVSQYEYLGTWITEDGKCEMDIKTRIGMALDAFWKHKELLRGNINLLTKKRMLNCYVYPVARYACESWTLNDDLSRCINSFEQWCYRRIMKIKWTDKISNEEVLQRIKEEELCLYNSVKKQKMAFAGHVLGGFSGKDLLDVLEGKLNSKLSQGRPRRMWLDDIKSWTGLDSYEKIKNLAKDRKSWRACSITCQPSDTEEDS